MTRVVDAPESESYLLNVKRALKSLVIGYFILAIVSKVREATGLLSCDCYPDCWCRRPGLSVFRWVFPRFHRNPGLEEWKKEQLGHSHRD